jgi:transmembrane sensor
MMAGRLASRWFARLRAANASPDTEAAFRRWLASDALHEEEFQRRERLWKLAGDLEYDPEIAELTAAAIAGIHDRRARLKTQRWRVAAAAATVIGLGITLALWQRPMPAPQESLYASAVGEQQHLVLEDGSQVVLNTGTRLRVRFTGRTRTVRLEQGEAIFSVRPDAARPFEVVSGSTMARALGTRFNVQYLGQEAEISVLEGRVQVAASGIGAVALEAGQAVRATQALGLMAIEPANLARIAAWQARRIEFDDISITDAIAEYNRYNLTQIVVDDPAIARLHISGAFRADDVRGFTNALHRAFGIRHVVRDGQLLLLPPE